MLFNDDEPRIGPDRLVRLLGDLFPTHLVVMVIDDEWFEIGQMIDPDDLRLCNAAREIAIANPFRETAPPVGEAEAHRVAIMVPLSDWGPCLVRYLFLSEPGDPPIVLASCRPAICFDRDFGALLETWSNFSRREAEIATRIAAGEKLSGISESLGITIHTARNQLKAAMKKADSHSQAELVARLHRWMG